MQALSSLIDSPVVATLLAIIASGVGAAVIGVFRSLFKLSLVAARLSDMSKDITDLKHDMDVIKWGAIASAQLQRPATWVVPGEPE